MLQTLERRRKYVGVILSDKHTLNTHRISKVKKVNKLWQKLSEQDNAEFKNYVYLREKEACNNKSRIIVQIIFQTLSSIFVSRNLLKKQLAPMLINVRKIFNCKVSFQMLLSKDLLIVAKEL